MKVEIIELYKDLEKDRYVEEGDCLTVDEKRGKQLIEAGVAREAEKASLSDGAKPRKSPKKLGDKPDKE